MGITIWEVHAHNYLSTLPLFMVLMIVVINWPAFINLVSLNWQGQFALQRVDIPHGGESYFALYLWFMAIVCVFPSCEEFLRCVFAALRRRKSGAPG